MFKLFVQAGFEARTVHGNGIHVTCCTVVVDKEVGNSIQESAESLFYHISYPKICQRVSFPLQKYVVVTPIGQLVSESYPNILYLQYNTCLEGCSANRGFSPHAYILKNINIKAKETNPLNIGWNKECIKNTKGRGHKTSENIIFWHPKCSILIKFCWYDVNNIWIYI